MAAADASREKVKVVLIDTQYVVTDPMSFKSVVQSLTGKDSCVSWIEENSFTGSASKSKEPTGNQSNGRPTQEIKPCAAAGDWRLAKGLSFKDLDRLLLDLPNSMEDWQKVLLSRCN